MTDPTKCPCPDAHCTGKTGSLSPAMQSLVEALNTSGDEITSGLRCPAHNAAVGGEPNSKHLTGEALDVLPAPGDPIVELVVYLLNHGTFRIITYGPADRHVHVQVDSDSRIYVKRGTDYIRAA